MSKAEIVALIVDPGVDYTLVPQKIMTYARFMRGAGVLKIAPGDWKELFFPYVHDLPGD